MNQVTPPQPVQSSPPPPILFAVTLTTGEIWQRGSYVPGSDTKSTGADGNEISGALIIVDMFPNEDGSVDVYASPVPGSAFDKQQAACIFTHTQQTVARLLTLARFDVWQQMLAEAREDALDPDDDDDVDNEVEPPAAPAPAVNGTPATSPGAS